MRIDRALPVDAGHLNAGLGDAGASVNLSGPENEPALTGVERFQCYIR